MLAYLVFRGLQRSNGAAGAQASQPRLLDSLRDRFGTLVLHSVCFLIPLAAVSGVIVYLNYARFSNVDIVTTYTANVPASSHTFWRGLYGNLLSPGRSVILYSPPIVLGLLGLGGLFRRFRAEAVLFSTIVLLYLVTYSVWRGWHGGWAWGPRFLLPAIPLIMISAAFFLQGRRSWLLAAGLTALGMTIQLLAVTVNYMHVQSDVLSVGLDPQVNMLFDWSISAIPLHFFYLLEGRSFDLWIWELRKTFGVQVFALTIAWLLQLFALGLVLLGSAPRPGVALAGSPGCAAREQAPVGRGGRRAVARRVR
jgi:hypothetical protein